MSEPRNVTSFGDLLLDTFSTRSVRLSLLALAGVVTLGFLLAWALTPAEYHCKAFLNLNKLPVPEFKSFQTNLNSVSFNSYLKAIGEADGRYGQILRENGGINQIVSPVFAYTASDYKQIPNLGREAANYVAGLEVQLRAEEVRPGLKMLELVRRYVADRAVKLKITDQVLKGKFESEKNISQTEKNVSGLHDQLVSLKMKLDRKKALLKNYPNTPSILGGSFSNLEKDGLLYLPPVLQVVGVESQIIEKEVQQAALVHRLVQLETTSGYYAAMFKHLKEARHGFELRRRMIEEYDRLRSSNRDRKSLAGYNDIKTEIAEVQEAREKIFYAAPPVSERVSDKLRWLKIYTITMLAILLACTGLAMVFRDELKRLQWRRAKKPMETSP